MEDRIQEIIKLDKDIVASTATHFRDLLKNKVENGVEDLILDFSVIEMIDSVGLGVIIATHNSLNNSNGKLSVINVSSDIFNLFKTMRLDQHFEVQQA